jgi:hypothetical protein
MEEKMIKAILNVVILSSIVFATESASSNDSTTNSNVKQINKDSSISLLPHIRLSNDPWTVTGYNVNTGFSSTTFNRHYFSIENGPQNIRVNYTASNLAPYLKPVPKAYSTIRMYKYCRILTPILMAGGPIIGASIIALSSHNFSTFNPTGAYIGGFILIFSWVPYGMSQGQVENAIDIYNKNIK